MLEITKLQNKILEDLYLRDVKKNTSIRINEEQYNLSEKGVINRVRELVFSIDKLILLDFITSEPNYYLESDKVSFKYMNNAVEILENRINISPLGIQYVEQISSSRLEIISKKINSVLNNSFINHPVRLIAILLVFIALGMILMKLLV